MSGSQKSPEIPVMLVCENDVFIAVPQSLLIKESAVFKAKLSPNWQGSESGNMEIDEKNVDNKPPETDNESGDVYPKVIKIEGYKGKAVKILIDWIQGYEDFLSLCKDFTILAEMLMFADFYDIPRPVNAIKLQLESLVIKIDNLITVMAAVGNLEKLELGNEISTSLESKCVKFASANFKAASNVSKFVTDNCDNIDLVIRLLHKCEGVLATPQAAPQVPVPKFDLCRDHSKSCDRCDRCDRCSGSLFMKHRGSCFKCDGNELRCVNCLHYG